MKKLFGMLMFAAVSFSLTTIAFAMPYTYGLGGDDVGSFDDQVLAVYNSDSGDATIANMFNSFPGSSYSLFADDIWKDENFVNDDGSNEWVQVYDGTTWVPSFWAYKFEFDYDVDHFSIKLGANNKKNLFYYDANGNDIIDLTEKFAINTVVYENLALQEYAVVDLSRFLWVQLDNDGNPKSETWLTGEDHYDKISHIAAPVPEPSTLLLLGAGLTGLAFCRRKKR